INPSAHPSADLTVLRKPNPPPTPPRLTPGKFGRLLRIGAIPRGPVNLPNATIGKQVCFSENVQYHSFRPDYDVQSEMKNTQLKIYIYIISPVKVRANAPLINPPAHPSAVLTVLRKPNPPPPPPRLTPVKIEETQRLFNSTNTIKKNGGLLRNGGIPGGPVTLPNGDVCAIHNIKVDKMTGQPLTHRPEKDRCSQATTRERVRFSENVLYHGYCPDCDVRSEMKNKEVHLHEESIPLAAKLPHHCPLPSKPSYPMENGGLGITSGVCHLPSKPGSQPPPTAPKPQKTILRKSTTTTV
ncbi:hypothetical protein AB205_0198900, partial [Aquarana catesbeiana]